MTERWSINDLTQKSSFGQTSVRTTGSSRWSSRTPGVSDGQGFSARSKTPLNYDSEASELEMERKKNTQSKTQKEETAETLLETFKQSWGEATDYAKTGTINSQKVKDAAEQKIDLGGATTSLVKGAVKSTGASMINAGSTVLQALDGEAVSGKSREELVAAPKPKTPEVMQYLHLEWRSAY